MFLLRHLLLDTIALSIDLQGDHIIFFLLEYYNQLVWGNGSYMITRCHEVFNLFLKENNDLIMIYLQI